METIETRVGKLEVRINTAERVVESLQEDAKILERSILAIEKTLTQIKYLAMGAAGAFIAQAVGLDKFIMKLFGV